jgi:hypothetical protein
MTPEEVAECLCVHDRANPNWLSLHCDLDMEDIPQPRNGCSCENCFYGRDRLALEIIRAQEERTQKISAAVLPPFGHSFTVPVRSWEVVLGWLHKHCVIVTRAEWEHALSLAARLAEAVAALRKIEESQNDDCREDARIAREALRRTDRSGAPAHARWCASHDDSQDTPVPCNCK